VNKLKQEMTKKIVDSLIINFPDTPAGKISDVAAQLADILGDITETFGENKS